jgi:hypothetical protein
LVNSLDGIRQLWYKKITTNTMQASPLSGLTGIHSEKYIDKRTQQVIRFAHAEFIDCQCMVLIQSEELILLCMQREMCPTAKSFKKQRNVQCTQSLPRSAMHANAHVNTVFAQHHIFCSLRPLSFEGFLDDCAQLLLSASSMNYGENLAQN